MDEQNKGVNERWAPTERDARGYAAEGGYPDAEDGNDDRSDRNTTAIRADIESTRENLRETVDAIQDRLRPGNVVSRAAGSMRNATVGRVKQMAAGVQGAMPSRSAGASNTVVERIRENPIPAALAAVSLAWLAFGGKRNPEYSSYDYRAPYDRDVNVYDETIGETLLGYEERGRTTESMRDTGDQAMRRARSAAQDARVRMRRATSEARRSAQRLTRDNPLAAAGAAAALGLVIGLAFPETEPENRLMGEARDSMVDRAKDAARSAAGRVQDAAQQAQRVAGDVIIATDSGDESQRPETGREDA